MEHELIIAVQEQLAECDFIQLVGTKVNTPTPADAELRETFMVNSPVLKGYCFADLFVWKCENYPDNYKLAINFFEIQSDGAINTLHLHDFEYTRADLERGIAMTIQDCIKAQAEAL